jgi:hypothetical protein
MKFGFNERVDYAAAALRDGVHNDNGRFDTCFEMSDGDYVAAALLRRAETDTDLAEALSDYLKTPAHKATWERSAAKCAAVASGDLKRHAANRRRLERRDFYTPAQMSLQLSSSAT